MGDGDELDQAASDVQADRHRLATEESHTHPLVGETPGYLVLQRATDVPHKLHFGNPLRASILPWGLAKSFTGYTPAHLLFRKPSLGMQQWTKTNAVQHLAALKRAEPRPVLSPLKAVPAMRQRAEERV